MFRKKNTMAIDVSRLAGLLPHDTCVRGDVLFAGGLRIDGRVEGNVQGKPDDRALLVLSEQGVIVGTVKVHDAVINGRVEGDLEVEHFLELQAGARVTGNITYRTLKLDCGAGLGAATHITGTFAFAAVGRALELLLKPRRDAGKN